MSEPLLNVLKILALVLVYLFFLRVLRAVWTEVRQPTVAAAAPAGPRGANRPRRGNPSRHLVVLEPQERRGHRYELEAEVTLGRASGCQVALDDTYVSQIHARIFAREGVFYVEDLGSTNGTYLNTRKVAAPTALKAGDRLRVGATVMEVGP
ncbi:MAG: FHA domain-containing protein [Acidimicrobiales bacterium]